MNMAKEADVVFTLDTTGSMSFAINAMKQVLLDVTTIYLENRVAIRTGLVEFRDLVDATKKGTFPMDSMNRKFRAIQHHTFEDGYFTSNINTFEDAIDTLQAKGGGPNPESSYDAILTAVRQSNWRDGAHRVIIHITDAPPNQPDLECQDADALVEGINQFGGLDQIHIICPEDHTELYEPLAMAKACIKEDSFSNCQFWNLDPEDTEALVEQLRNVTKTSSDDIDGAEVLLDRDDAIPNPVSENPFDEDDDTIETLVFEDDSAELDDDFMFDDD
jgi:DNA-directed RNA polymerase subunit F